jgi:CubicO group peptidase (beta-lactamase class C family)
MLRVLENAVMFVTFRLLPVLCLLAQPVRVALAQNDFDGVVEDARRAFDVPGIAVAIVQDGKVLVARGYGVRRLGDPAPVTGQSLFRIASNTKAFTAAALAMLVDEGRIRWDDPVVQHMPAFQMYDPYVTREMTVRDLLVHRSGLGLGAGDLMFFPPSDLTREEIIRRLRFVKPASSFRSRYAYDNLLYLVAGQLIPAVTGKSWDDFVRERILVPLGMTSTTVSTRALRAAPDVAVPHSRAGGKLEPIGDEDVDNNAPAGSISSSAADLAKWMILQLGRGAYPGGRLFSETRSKEMWSPQTILPIEDLPPGAPPELAAVQPNFNTYGLGWILRDYRGRKIVFHTGGLAGYVSRVTLVPELKLGVAVLTNQEAGGAFTAVTWSILDQYLGAPPSDWVTLVAALEERQAAEARAEVAKAAGSRNAASRPSLPLAGYAGRYRDPWYGDVLIREQGGKLAISFTHSPQLNGSLEHWQYDTFVARWTARYMNADAYVTFSLKPNGAIDQVKMAPVSPLTDFSFDFQDLLLAPVALNAPPR